MGCIFCKIIKGDIASEIVYRDDRVVAIRDIEPKAPIHVLVLSVEHIASLSATTDEHRPLIGHMVAVANELARSEGIAESGYRLVINSGPDAGQDVHHLHLHVLGGRKLGWRT
ncbi:MAG: histidine triad nucleotide-binding protein [Chloroflexota bacterium]|nr:histidine triad nucleotide-binding protein [Chloroflexota bacterium]